MFYKTEDPFTLMLHCLSLCILPFDFSSSLLLSDSPKAPSIQTPQNSYFEALACLWKRTGIQTPGGHKQNLGHTRTQEKGAVTPQETDPDLPLSVQESLAEVWVSSSLLQRWGYWVQQCVHGTFLFFLIYFLLKDNCFTEFCCFLSNLNMNQP